VISTSDIVILVVASGALATGIYRWHENTQDVSAITIPANSRVVVEPLNNSAKSVLSGENTLSAASSNEPTTANSNQVVVQTLPEPTPVASVVLSADGLPSESTALGSHQVRTGDYLGKIANRYGTDVQTLRDLNNIRGTVIHIGQEILYPL